VKSGVVDVSDPVEAVSTLAAAREAEKLVTIEPPASALWLASALPDLFESEPFPKVFKKSIVEAAEVEALFC
jgi:hypothetical protein